MKPLNDKWPRRIITLALALVLNFFYFRNNRYDFDAKIYLSRSVLSTVYIVLIWELTVGWVLYVRSRYANINQTRQRVVTTIVGYVSLTVILQLVFVGLIDLAGFYVVALTWRSYALNVVGGLVCTVLIGSTYEAIYYLRKYGEAVQEAEAVKKEGLQSQYDSLKNQVNPHFLFNSLNCLSALISEDKRRAGLFLDELSSVYRYLLQAGQKPMVTLSEEVSFLNSYRYLLDTRFGDVLRWELDMNEYFADCLLPSLTLQVLIENALRHNQLLSDQPLRFFIQTTVNGELVVRNSIKRKRTSVAPSQGRLMKLAANFEMLGFPQPVIEDDGRHFTVRIALFQREQILSGSVNPKLSNL
ncbi:sensor histidine kinase [Runella sp.]|uniref:sensor histidine kinase n=1 Tax=Runella sp. TaxID=1960881 RepID=UPI003D149FD3